MKFKLSWGSFKSPTPAVVKRIATSVIKGTLFVSGSSFAMQCTKLAAFILIIGGIATFVLDFYSDSST